MLNALNDTTPTYGLLSIATPERQLRTCSRHRFRVSSVWYKLPAITTFLTLVKAKAFTRDAWGWDLAAPQYHKASARVSITGGGYRDLCQWKPERQQ